MCFYAFKVQFSGHNRPHNNCDQRVKMTTAAGAKTDSKKRQIFNPSLTSITSVFSSQIRRKLEFSNISPYNEFDKLLGYNGPYLKRRKW